MRLLLDTHVLLWWLTDDPQLSANAVRAIGGNDGEVFVSVATAWEIALMVGTGKWPEAASLLQNIETELASEGFSALAIDIVHVRHAGLMTNTHRDPFDRLLAAQAFADDLTIVTKDARLRDLGVAWLW